MNKEIKEILLKDFNEILVKEFCTDWKEKRLYIELLVNSTPFSNLLDYITNLQEENERLKADYGTKAQVERDLLQKENERLKELCDKYEEEHNTTFKLWTMKMEEIPTYEEKKELQDRIDKAIEYIEQDYDKNEEVIEYCNFEEVYKHILEILQGKSDE